MAKRANVEAPYTGPPPPRTCLWSTNQGCSCCGPIICSYHIVGVTSHQYPAVQFVAEVCG